MICCDNHFATTGGGNWKTTGISGHGSFAGDIEELLPFLMLGTYVHAGKNAAFGMGAYELKIS